MELFSLVLRLQFARVGSGHLVASIWAIGVGFGEVVGGREQAMRWDSDYGRMSSLTKSCSSLTKSCGGTPIMAECEELLILILRLHRLTLLFCLVHF